MLGNSGGQAKDVDRGSRGRSIEISSMPCGHQYDRSRIAGCVVNTNRSATGHIDAARFTGGRTRRPKNPTPCRNDVLANRTLVVKRFAGDTKFGRPPPTRNSGRRVILNRILTDVSAAAEVCPISCAVLLSCEGGQPICGATEGLARNTLLPGLFRQLPTKRLLSLRNVRFIPIRVDKWIRPASLKLRIFRK